MPRPVFHTAHYNILAAQFSEAFKRYQAIEDTKNRIERTSALVDLALSMAQRFKKDNPEFDPHKWLDACSGDVDLYPLSELWEAYSE